MIIVIKMVLLNVNQGNRLIIKYQTINNLASIFEKYTSGLPKAVFINSNLIVSTLSTSFILDVRSIGIHLLNSSHKFIYRYCHIDIERKAEACKPWRHSCRLLTDSHSSKQNRVSPANNHYAVLHDGYSCSAFRN